MRLMRMRVQQGHTEIGRGALAQAAARLVGTDDCTEYVDELIQSGTLVGQLVKVK
jgi:hypothetical protein